MSKKLRKNISKEEKNTISSEKDFFDEFFKVNTKHTSKTTFYNGFCKL